VNLTAERQGYLTSTQAGCTFLTGRPIEFDAPWIHFVSTHGGGFQLEVAVEPNTGPERTGHVITEIGVITIVQGPGNCVTAIAPTGQTFDENGGTGSFTVTAVQGCPWEATPHDDSSYTLLPYHGSGNGVVTFKVPSNAGSYPYGPYFIVGGALRFQITLIACRVVVSPLNVQVPTSGGFYSFVVSTSHDSCAWPSASNDQFITLSQQNGIGPRSVQFNVARNDTGVGRTGHLTVATEIITVTQNP
jgi:hypothetical protein